MFFSSFISSRIQQPTNGSFSAIVSKITIAGVASGIFVMIITFSILFGFKQNIEQKIFSFGGHITLNKYDLNQSYEEKPITINPIFVKKCTEHPNIEQITPYSFKPGLIKTKTEVQGIVIKGIDAKYNQSTFSKNIKLGRFLKFNDTTDVKEVILSKKMASKLGLKLNQDIVVFFAQHPPRVRKLKIVGIFETDMEEFDENILMADLKLLRKINNWSDSLAGGYEISLKDVSQLKATSDFVYNLMDYDLGMETILSKYAHIFDWLNLLDQNVQIFLTLIIIVACFNMISSLIIIIMERTQTIGILKALGANNQSIIQIFVLNGISLIIKGLVIGNVLAIGFCALQYYFKIIPLDAENYYMSSVPIAWNWWYMLFLNSALLLITSLVLFIPAIIITKISPIKAIRFD